MNPSRIGVLSTLHAANLQLSALFFVEVARTQALSASDAPSPITSSLFSVGMLRSSITSSFFEVLARKIGSRSAPEGPRPFFGPLFRNMSKKDCALFSKRGPGPILDEIGPNSGPQGDPKNHKKSWKIVYATREIEVHCLVLRSLYLNTACNFVYVFLPLELLCLLRDL